MKQAQSNSEPGADAVRRRLISLMASHPATKSADVADTVQPGVGWKWSPRTHQQRVAAAAGRDGVRPSKGVACAPHTSVGSWELRGACMAAQHCSQTRLEWVQKRQAPSAAHSQQWNCWAPSIRFVSAISRTQRRTGDALKGCLVAHTSGIVMRRGRRLGPGAMLPHKLTLRKRPDAGLSSFRRLAHRAAGELSNGTHRSTALLTCCERRSIQRRRHCAMGSRV